MQIFTQICCVFYSNLVKYLLKSCILFTQNLFFTPLSKFACGGVVHISQTRVFAVGIDVC